MIYEKTVFITGVSRGLGRAMAFGFAARGYRVVGCARSSEAIEELTEKLGEPHLFRSLDVMDETALVDLARDITPDLLINSAALINRSAPLWEVPAEEFSDVIDVNIKGVANIIRHFLPPMIECGSGVVVNFSSGWGRSTSPEVAPYCATKWAIEGLTMALAQEVPPGLAAVAFNPGVIDTAMLRTCYGAQAANYSSPEEWAEAAVPFLDDLTAADNGASLTSPGH